jgi:hypothetical protein
MEIECIFSLVGILDNLRICLHSDNLEILFFVSKNWFNDSRIDYRKPSNLVKLNGMDMKLEKELEKFEGSFERDEIIHM